MSNSAGKITTPVRQISDLRKVLGVEGGTGKLCTSSAINERAAYKPTALAGYAPLTHSQRLSVNYSTHVNIYNDPISLIQGVVRGDAWSYSRPFAPYYRQGDFNGYDHNAKDWITVTPQADTISVDRPLPMDLYGNDDALPASLDALASLLDMGYLAGYRTLNFGFLLQPGGFSLSARNCRYIPLTGEITIYDIVDNGKLTIPADTFASTGTWHIMPVLTTASYTMRQVVQLDAQSGSTGLWLPIPYSNICSVEVVDNVQDYPVDKHIDIELDSADITISDRGVVSVANVVVRIVNSDSSDHRIIVGATIKSGVIGNPVVLDGGSANVPSGGSALVTLQSSPLQFDVADPTMARLAIELEYYESGLSDQKRTKYIYYEFYTKSRRILL